MFLADAKNILRLAHPHRFWGGEDPVFWGVFNDLGLDACFHDLLIHSTYEVMVLVYQPSREKMHVFGGGSKISH